jgi:Protein of unknown function (DUF5818)
MSPRMRVAVWLVPLVLFSLCPLLVAQYGDAQSDQSNMSQITMGPSHPAVTVTGCLNQGKENGGYYLTAKDGKVYELSGKADFAKHVGHTVTVTGHEVPMSKADESKMEMTEKTEAGGKSYADLKVMNMKHVSETCTQ